MISDSDLGRNLYLHQYVAEIAFVGTLRASSWAANRQNSDENNEWRLRVILTASFLFCVLVTCDMVKFRR